MVIFWGWLASLVALLLADPAPWPAPAILCAPAVFGCFFAGEITRWAGVVRAAGIRAE
jgi:hypothetical protein